VITNWQGYNVVVFFIVTFIGSFNSASILDTSMASVWVFQYVGQLKKQHEQIVLFWFLFNCFVFRYRHRRTLVNILLAFGRLVSLASLFFPVFIFSGNHFLCIWIYLLFPGLVLFEKLLQSFQSIARYLYIFCEKLMNICCHNCLCLTLFFLVFFFTCLPYLTALDYYPTLFVTCEPFASDDKPSNYQVPTWEVRINSSTFLLS
jgi:hypothetical protein